MKTIKPFSVILLTSFLLLACEPTTEMKNDPLAGQPVSLKASINEGVENLATAVKSIQNSESFELLASIVPETENSGGASFAPEIGRAHV